MWCIEQEDLELLDSNFVQKLLPEYQISLKSVEQLYRNADADDKKVIAGMVSDCKYVIEWLSSGRRPGNKRGIERRAGYEREILLEPVRMQNFTAGFNAVPSEGLTEDQCFQLEYVLGLLSRRERECYMLANGEGFSHVAIAGMLMISAGSVSEYIQRAQKKISSVMEEYRSLI
ncbi:ECF subfamily RNA polymerase sigma-24 subunit [Paenibacillus sp. FSL R7-277]|uniref:sigma factor-like helix-turn-helix DNA-binding protein n=1 Tax=Paenibacillus sp. FSL R7-0128 TaxID=2954529 RepID=UPI0003E1E6F4|nr:ECF subfamily RNA polymerase sigma-24 subunit [Paenibacillus sp. FSL R7-277]